VYRTKDVKGARVVGLGTSDFIKSDYYKEHKMSEYDFDFYGHNTNGNESGNDNTASTQNSTTSADSNASPINSTGGINEFGASSLAGNHKVEDIYIDLDMDGVNDMTYSDPIISAPNEKKKDKKEGNNSSSTDSTNDEDIIKF
jgi:hypothetical protein